MLFYKTLEHKTSKEWVVFVHGAGGSSSIWYKQLRAFSSEFNVLLIDLRGHGQSQPMYKRVFNSPYTFPNISSDIIEVLDFLEIRRAHFVGISLGSIVIRSLGEQAPDRIKSMVLGGAVTRLDTRSTLLVFGGNLVKRFVPYMWIYKLYAYIIMPKANHSEARKLFVGQAEKLIQSEFLKWFKLTNGINKLLSYFKEKELNLPTLYIMGGEDHMFLKPVKVIVEEHKSAFLKVIENCGHVVNVEQPDLFNQMSISFIKEHQQSALEA